MNIKKVSAYINHVCLLEGIDEERQTAFNAGETIAVTEEEFNTIGPHRWLEVVEA